MKTLLNIRGNKFNKKYNFCAVIERGINSTVTFCPSTTKEGVEKSMLSLIKRGDYVIENMTSYSIQQIIQE